MQTVEERLAALEKQMAAWIDQQPTTYYTHQYSGEEIDAAVGRALTGGALDTSVTNVSNQLGTFTRPNLLDNWYFGRPVNQRNGYIIPRDTQIYADSTLTDTSPGVTTAWRQVEYVNSTYCIYRGTEGSGLYYVKTSDAIPGYCSVGYTVDRWMLYTDGGNVAISNGYLDIYASKQHGTYLTQKIDPELAKALAGKTVTWSVLAVGGDIAFSANINKDDSYVDSFVIEPNTISFKTFTFPTDFTDISFIFAGNDVGHVCPIAAKLELGPTQTLAHQENGVWVMNEVPEYGEQLRRCQRYAIDGKYYTTVGKLNYDGNVYYISVQFPFAMRTLPAITLKEISAIGWGTLPISSAELSWVDANGFFIAIKDLSNMDNFIGRSCVVTYFATADL